MPHILKEGKPTTTNFLFPLCARCTLHKFFIMQFIACPKANLIPTLSVRRKINFDLRFINLVILEKKLLYKNKLIINLLSFSDDYQSAQLLGLILELLTFCVEHHTYHIKNYVISKNVLNRVLVLLKSRHSFLVLCKCTSFDLIL